MDLTTISLEALLLKATHNTNQNVDCNALEAFVALVNQEEDGVHIGVKVIAEKIPKSAEKEALQILNLLDRCMAKCGTPFQNEVGKFRFLNEMIKMVSPKYLANHTPVAVKQKILQLLYVWTLDYPKESKIKEAFDMLRKQGVVREIPNPNIATDTVKKRQVDSIFDEDQGKFFQKLLQSKDPEALRAANCMIENKVKEEEKKSELKSKRISELESVRNNARLLNEMLDSYKPGGPELDLIKELHHSCQRLKSTVLKLAREAQQNEDLLSEILHVSDELSAVQHKFQVIIVKRKISKSQTDLLEFENPEMERIEESPIERDLENIHEPELRTFDVLCDIFTNNAEGGDILKPVTCESQWEENGENSKSKGMEELDILGEILMKESLGRSSTCNGQQEKLPMNQISKANENKKIKTANQMSIALPEFDLNYLVQRQSASSSSSSETSDQQKTESDDLLVDITDEKMLDDSINDKQDDPEDNKNIPEPNDHKTEINLKQISIKLEEIKPSSVPPLTILEGKNDITVTLHVAKDKPRENVHVYVITSISKNECPISNFLFQAVVPKGCKLKIQAPSTTDLPAFNPFLPPSAITQIMIVANPEILAMSLKFIISYIMDDETITEMGEIDSLPTAY